jgi:choline dehydrogenase-like flavoprotein
MSNEVTIVGSGAAGVAAALRLADLGIRSVIVDVGIEPKRETPITENLYGLRDKADLFDVMIGRNFERIRSLSHRAPRLPAKLTAPRIGFVTQDADRLSPLRETNFAAVRSFATGGLANAWGGSLYRTTEQDLPGFPVPQRDLSAHYDRLTKEIGISGQDDDLTRFFGSAAGLQHPLRLSRKAQRLLARYERCRSRINRAGFFLGRPRLGILSEPFSGRCACDYTNLEFWQPDLPYIYNPKMTLRRLIDEGMVSYRRRLLVESWSRTSGAITVHALDLANRSPISFSTRFLVLAAGAIGSGKLALASNRDYRTRLGLLDNPAVQFPLILPRFIGQPLETDSFGLTQLNVVCESSPYASPLQASILEITSPARSEFFASLPLSARDNLRMIRYLVPAMLIMQLFSPAGPQDAARLSLSADGTLTIEGPSQQIDTALIDRFAKIMRKIGAFTHRSLVVVPPPGHGIHYAGTLPMSERPNLPYHCDPFCRLAGQPDVYVVDGSVLPYLPAKNYSFLMMANAMRAADHLSAQIRNQRCRAA